ncbi:MAG TPA: hypothetical protein VN605_05260 [Thermoanaerobaculia bacterium]|nr:hypothetical protein [Thermoanaerobaculia bacterium]
MRGLRDGFGPFQRTADQLLMEAGILEWSDETFTPVGAIMRFFNLAEERYGPEILFEFGKQDARYMPLDTVSLLEFLARLSQFYLGQHTNANYGSAFATVLSPVHAIAWSTSPYPCEVETGLLAGVFSYYRIRPQILHTTPCRRDGAFACLWRLVWGDAVESLEPELLDLAGLS